MKKMQHKWWGILCAFCIMLLNLPSQTTPVYAEGYIPSTSQTGIDLIRSYEGLSLYAYKAHGSEACWTIGYGHYGEDVWPGMVIDQASAEQMLLDDIVTHEFYLDDFLNTYGIQVTQGQYDALSSFTFNLGNVWAYDDFALKNILINGAQNYSDQDIRNAFGEWICAADGEALGGLVSRRSQEADMFLANRSQVDGLVYVQELYSPYSGQVFYTTDQNEILNMTAQGWVENGVAFIEPSVSNMPVYRLLNQETGQRCYTVNINDYYNLTAQGWVDEGIAFYSDGLDPLPIYC